MAHQNLVQYSIMAMLAQYHSLDTKIQKATSVQKLQYPTEELTVVISGSVLSLILILKTPLQQSEFPAHPIVYVFHYAEFYHPTKFAELYAQHQVFPRTKYVQAVSVAQKISQSQIELFGSIGFQSNQYLSSGAPALQKDQAIAFSINDARTILMNFIFLRYIILTLFKLQSKTQR